MTERMIIGVTGASGIVYAVRLLEVLHELEFETHLVISRAAQLVREYETSISKRGIEALADYTYGPADIGASIASGSFKTRGMIIAPCSIKTMSEIAYGTTTNLVSRAADVVLKERRKLALLLRESPLHAGHIQTMLRVTEAGGIIAPAVTAFYSKPETIQDMVDHTVGRLLSLFDIETDLFEPWTPPSHSTSAHKEAPKRQPEAGSIHPNLDS